MSLLDNEFAGVYAVGQMTSSNDQYSQGSADLSAAPDSDFTDLIRGYQRALAGPAEWPETPTLTSILYGREGDIIGAAFECIVELGLAHTTTRAVARRAGMSQGFIHYHFASKEDLILRVAERLGEHIVGAIEAVAAADMSGSDKIRTVVRMWRPVEYLSAEFVAFIALWTHANAVRGPILEVMRTVFRRYRAAYESIAAQGHREGSLTDQAAELLPGILVAMPWGLGLQTAIEPGSVDWDRLVKAAISTLTIETGGGDANTAEEG